MIKKINPLRYVIVLMLAVYSVSSYFLSSGRAQAANVVQNPGFETAGAGGAGDAANWTEGANHARASDKFNTGSWSLKSTFRGAGTDTRQTVSISASTTYTYSGYVWRTNTVGGACLDMNDIIGELQQCVTTAGSWQFKSGTWSSGSNTSMTLRLITDGSPTGDVWFDDISLDSGAGPTPTSTLTRTNTPTGPTNTPTRTNTPAPPTNTPTRTNTPTGPTNTPTRTNTPVPPTHTRTNTPAAPGNLVQNPGFESGTGGDASNWVEGLNHARANDKFNTGGWSLKSTFRGAGTDTRQTVSIATGVTYTYSGYIWKTNAVGSACMDMNDIVGELALCASTTGSWQFVTGTWGSGSFTSVTLRLVTDASPTGDFWYDDIALVGPGAPTPTATGTATKTKTPTPGPSPTPLSNTGVLGNTFVGYQGWFDAAGSGSPINRWNHWAPGISPAPGNIKFELYPDTREYTSLFQTSLGNLGNGSPAKLFSSYSNQTVNLHFSWMRTNNIDGVGLQRFGNELADPGTKAFRDGITLQVKDAAEANGRLFYIMYDVTGMGSGFVADIENDWTNTITGSMNLTASPMYARQNGKPVVSLWGVGFLDRPGSASDWTSLINWFKNRGIYVIGGTPRDWRTGGGDSKSGFINVYTSLNMISPWTVGMATLTNDAGVDGWMNNYIIPDRDYLATRGVDYQPVVFPGFAWSNWNGGVRNQLPRRAGNLLWRMVYNVKRSNISTVYIAMFDEYDEGTAIAKAAEDSSMIPNNQYFLTLDADGTHMSSDFYLRLAGSANKMLKGQIPLSPNIPIPYQ